MGLYGVAASASVIACSVRRATVEHTTSPCFDGEVDSEQSSGGVPTKRAGDRDSRRAEVSQRNGLQSG
jgi:hypothetical protein